MSYVTRGSLPIPPELLEAILECLHPPARWDDGRNKQVLVACTLVSREWQAIAQPHLFCSVRFRFSNVQDGDSGEREKQNTAEHRRGFSPSLAAFHEFLAAHPSIRACIRTLNLRPRHAHLERANDTSLLDYLEPEIVDNNVLHSLLSLLPHLRHVAVAGIRLVERVPHPRCLLGSLDTLEISGLERQTTWEPCTYDISAVLDMFTAVRSLHVAVPLNVPMGGRTITPVACKVAAAIHESRGSDAFTTLIQALDARCITSLQLPSDCVRQKDQLSWLPIQELLQSGVGEQLVHLGIQLRAESDIDQLGGLLRMCPKLHSLTIVICMIADVESLSPLRSLIIWHAASWRNLAKFISRIPTFIQHLTFMFDILPISRAYPVGMLANTALERVVEDALFERFEQKLPMVSVLTRSKPAFDLREQQGIRAVFPRLSSGDMLEF